MPLLSLTTDGFHLQAKYLVREEKEGCGDCPLHGRVALRRASTSSGNGKTSTSSSLGNTRPSSSVSSLPRSFVATRQSSNGHNGLISSTYDTGQQQGRPSTPFLGSTTRPPNISVNGRASPSPPPSSSSSHPPSLYSRFSSPAVHIVPAPNTPSVRRKSSKEKPAPPPPMTNGKYREQAGSLRRKHSAPQPPTFPLEAPELIRRNSIGGNPTRQRPPLPSEWSQDVAGSAGRRQHQEEFVRNGGDRRSLRSSHHVAPPSHLNPTFSSLSRTHTVIPLLPSSLPSYFLPASSPPPHCQEEIPEDRGVKPENLDEGTASLPSPSPSLQSILKPAGKRRPSQNHRVGFLDSLGKEIEQSRQF